MTSSPAALDAVRASVVAPPVRFAPLDIALLGCGNVGSAFAELAGRQSTVRTVRITCALVRDRVRPRPALPADAVRIDDRASVFAGRPDVVVELLGGTEPARSLILEALGRGIPVVTANKSLLAAHGSELREAATRTGTPLLYEAAVIAGVPFLGTFGRRPQAGKVTKLAGIANGTTNYILTRARDAQCSIDGPLAEAQALGYAEPDPSFDIDGIDAAEKLIVLLQHFAAANVAKEALEIAGIREISAAAIDHAREFGGTIKPVVYADWSGSLEAFAGPAFVPSAHPFAAVDGAENAVSLAGSLGRLIFRGPGAGPAVTAATVLDDVFEAVAKSEPYAFAPLDARAPGTPETGWFVTVSAPKAPCGVEIADLLGSYGVCLRRTSDANSRDGQETIGALTYPASRDRLEAALQALTSAVCCRAVHCRILED